MLNQELPIELIHDGILLDKTGRKWKAGKYPANTVPFELTEDVRGVNFEASEEQKYSQVPSLDDKDDKKEPELKLEAKIEDKPPARVAQPAAAVPAPPTA
jgi:hypothetical protein